MIRKAIRFPVGSAPAIDRISSVNDLLVLIEAMDLAGSYPRSLGMAYSACEILRRFAPIERLETLEMRPQRSQANADLLTHEFMEALQEAWTV